MFRVSLIVPPTGLYVRSDRCQSSVADFAVAFARPPVDLALAAAYLREAGARVRLADFPMKGLSWKQLEEELSRSPAELIVFSSCTSSLRQDLEACRLARRLVPGALVALRGNPLDPRLLLAEGESLDLLVTGEEPSALAALARGLPFDEIPGLVFRRHGQVMEAPPLRPASSLDESPMPAWDLLDWNDYRRPDTGRPCAHLEVSRGCPGGCLFCLAGPLHGATVRTKSPERIVREALHCRKRHGIVDFHLASDCFTHDRAWLHALCSLWTKKLPGTTWFCNGRVDEVDEDLAATLAAGGCFAIGLGVESGDEESLRRMGKGTTRKQARRAVAACRHHGILAYTYFMVGFPWEDEGSVRRTLDFAVKLDGDLLDVFYPFPFPKTPLHRLAEKEGWLETKAGGGAYARSVMKTPLLSRERLGQLRRRTLLRFYLRPRLWWRHLRRIPDLTSLGRALGQALALFARLGRGDSS